MNIIMLSTLSLLLLLCTICVSAGTFTHEFVDNDLLSGCRFKLGENDYNLCPLILSSDSRTVGDEVLRYEWTTGATEGRSYTVAMDGMGRDRECPEGTWICMNKPHGDYNDPQHEPQIHTTFHIPIAGKSRPDSLLVDQGINAVASILSTDDYPSTPHLNIFFIGGFWQGRAQYARVDFVCDLNVKRGAPVFVEERHDVHIFTWVTQYGCPVNRGSSVLENEPKPNTDSEGVKSGLVDKPSLMTFCRAMILSSVVISPMLVALFIILIRPRERQILLTHTKVPLKENKGWNGKGRDEYIM